ncbi:hypothetical protein NFI96_002359 [Prochilodus magdalenae]|nr:hypothetical protein NFI96_002359 [Prochilodus magdalenae]
MDYSLGLYTYRVSCMVSGADGVDSECRYEEVDVMKCISPKRGDSFEDDSDEEQDSEEPDCRDFEDDLESDLNRLTARPERDRPLEQLQQYAQFCPELQHDFQVFVFRTFAPAHVRQDKFHISLVASAVMAQRGWNSELSQVLIPHKILNRCFDEVMFQLNSMV